MNSLPKILVIDDVYGKKGKERDNFCIRLGLKDRESKISTGHPVGEAVLLSGQVEKGGVVVNDLEGVIETIREGWAAYPRWSLVLLDLHFETGKEEERIPENYFGLKILKELYRREGLKDIPVIIMSAMGRERIEQLFADYGALDFVDKSEMNKEVLMELLFTHGLVETENAIGYSIPFLISLREARRRAVAGNENILVLGETGTGKELLAEYIHSQSGRKGLFNPLFTQGVPETLIEDRLFGHCKGAFDGALHHQPGAAELADHGTLFIDEFGNIPSSIQERLLRLLDKNIREIQRIGSQERKELDLLVVMATNRLDILSVNDFRGDILFRAKAGTPIVLPPLRDRREDILPLAEFFVEKFDKTFAAQKRTISEEARAMLMAYDWPGNIRELEGAIEYAVYNYKGLRVLSANHLPLEKDFLKKQKPPASGSKEEHGEMPPVNTVPMPGENISQQFEKLIELMDNLSFDGFRKEQLKGQLPEFRSAYARLIAKYLGAALNATLSYSSRNPDGEVSYHPAIKWITGDFAMKATPAKRLLNNLLKIAPEAITEVLKSNPVLQKALDLYGDESLKNKLNNENR